MTLRGRKKNAPIALATGLLMLAAAGAQSAHAEQVTVGQLPGTSIFYLPTYIAVDKGLFADEGLDVRFVSKDTDRELTAAGVGRKIDFVPDTGGARVSIKGAPVRYIVGQSQVSRWVIVADPETVSSIEALKGKSLALGTPGSADYEEATDVLSRYFDMAEAHDYRTVSIPDEKARLAALLTGKVQAALLPYSRLPKAGVEGMDAVLKIGHYRPQLEGAYWVTADYLEENPETVRRFIRAIGRATQYLATEQSGSIDVIKKRFGLESLAEANVLWHAVHREFDPDIPADLLRRSFQANLARLRASGLWPKDRPMPAVEQFVARNVMKTALWEVDFLKDFDY